MYLISMSCPAVNKQLQFYKIHRLFCHLRIILECILYSIRYIIWMDDMDGVELFSLKIESELDNRF